MPAPRIFAIVAAVAAGLVYAQPPAAIIASIKPNNDAEARTLMDTLPGGRFTGIAVTVNALLRAAYQVQPRDIVGAPGWFATKRYDITAQTDGGDLKGPEVLQALLRDRFGMQMHHEKREQPTFDLVVIRNDGKLGPKMIARSFDCAAYHATPHAPEPGAVRTDSVPECGGRVNSGNISGKAISMAQLATSLVPGSGRRVTDKTGLSGVYDVDLVWTPDPPAGAPNDDRPPSIFTAVQEQLGLKLVPDKAIVDVLIVDHASEPTEN